jgi:hypothetical protein
MTGISTLFYICEVCMSNTPDFPVLVMHEPLTAKDLIGEALAQYSLRRCAAVTSLESADIGSWFDEKTLSELGHWAGVVMSARGFLLDSDPVDALRYYLIGEETREAALANERMFAASLREALGR